MCNPVAAIMGISAIAGLFVQQDAARRQQNQAEDAKKEAEQKHKEAVVEADRKQQRSDKLRKRDMSRAAAASLPQAGGKPDTTVALGQGSPTVQRKTLLGS
jgi:Tfp pilus assembly major pilin PilA